MGLFLTALGLMMIFEGIPYFCFPDRFKDLALKISTVESRTLRIIGIAIIILGLMVVQFGRSLMHHD